MILGSGGIPHPPARYFLSEAATYAKRAQERPRITKYLRQTRRRPRFIVPSEKLNSQGLERSQKCERALLC